MPPQETRAPSSLLSPCLSSPAIGLSDCPRFPFKSDSRETNGYTTTLFGPMFAAVATAAAAAEAAAILC